MALKQLAFLAVMSFACLQLVAGDVYPGDTTFNNIFSGLRNRVSQNRISFSLLHHMPMTRHGLCCLLTEKFNYIHGTNTQSNRVFMEISPISSSDCTGALQSPSATLYNSSPAGWKMWGGVHQGTWYGDNGPSFADKSTWGTPVTNSGSGGPYQFQSGTFNSRTGCTFSICGYGWKNAGTSVS